MRPGSLLIWDSRIPHGNYPNESSQFRMVQYITFCERDPREEERLKRLEPFVDVGGISSLFPCYLNFYFIFADPQICSKQIIISSSATPEPLRYKFPDLSELGKKLLGVERWAYWTE